MRISPHVARRALGCADCCHSGTLLDYGEIALDLGDPNGAAHFSRAALNRSMEVREHSVSDRSCLP